jgi:hypothetical protein
MRRDWTPEEDAQLRAFHATDLNAEQIALRFVDRTTDSVNGRMRKLRLGLRTIARAKWTAAEVALLREVWFEKGSLKEVAARHFPSRGWRGLMEQGRELGLPIRTKLRGSSYSWVAEEVNRVLAAEPNLTVPELVKRCAGSRKRITTLLADGHGTEYFKSGWERVRVSGNGGWWPRWSLGAGPDAPKPEAMSDAFNGRQYRARQRVRTGKFDPFASLVGQVAS